MNENKHLFEQCLKIGPSIILGSSSFTKLIEGGGPRSSCSFSHVCKGGHDLLLINVMDCGVNGKVSFD